MKARIDALRVLEARAQARALLFRCGEYEDSGEAVGALLAYAHESGIAADFGFDYVLEIVRVPFREIAGVEL